MTSLYLRSPAILGLPSEAYRVFRTFVFSLLLGAALLVSAPGAHAQTDAKTAEEFLRSSGLWAQLATVAPQMRTGFSDAAAQAGVTPTPAELERMSRVIDSAFSAQRLRASAITIFRSDLQAEHVPALRRWYSSSPGKNITAVEEAESASQATTDPLAIVQQGSALLSAMPAARRTMLQEYVQVTRSAEMMAQFTVDTTVAMQQGLLSVTPNATDLSAKELRATLEAQRPQMIPALAEFSLAIYARTYSRLPTAELRKYVDFMKTKAGRHFMDVSFEAFTAAMVDASAEFGRGLPGAKDKSNT